MDFQVNEIFSQVCKSKFPNVFNLFLFLPADALQPIEFQHIFIWLCSCCILLHVPAFWHIGSCHYSSHTSAAYNDACIECVMQWWWRMPDPPLSKSEMCSIVVHLWHRFPKIAAAMYKNDKGDLVPCCCLYSPYQLQLCFGRWFCWCTFGKLLCTLFCSHLQTHYRTSGESPCHW